MLTAVTVLMVPVAVAGIGEGNGGGELALRRAESAVGLDNPPGAAAQVPAFAVRKLQFEEELERCTDDTSVGDAEAGIAIYYDEEACDRADPEVGCNGEWSRSEQVVVDR